MTAVGRIVDVLGGLDTGTGVSLLFASGATLEGSLEDMDAAGTWAVVVERFDVEAGGASRERALRHTVDVGALVAVGVLEP